MSWNQILTDAGLSEREVNALTVLSKNPNIKASELAKELDTTRLDAYNSLERLQRIGLVTTTADRPMRFSSPPLDHAVTHLIEIRKEQLNRIEQGLGDIKSGAKYSSTSTDPSTDDEPKFAVLKERVHIMKRIEKLSNESKKLIRPTFEELNKYKNVIISTTGYTGSGGFEIYCNNNDAIGIWNILFDIGKQFDIKPIGLAARDTLRLEMGYCLYGNEINSNTNPIEAGLNWITKTNKGTEFESSSIIIAAGVGSFEPRKFPTKEIDKYEGNQILYSIKDKTVFKDKTVVIFGGGDSALDWAIELSNSSKVILVHRRDDFRGMQASIDKANQLKDCLLYTSPSPRDVEESGVAAWGG